MNSGNRDPRTTEKSGQDQRQDQAEQGGQEEKRNILGEKLRRARSGKGISLEEAAAATRIHAATLAALEENNQRLLPAQVFTRGFVRIYAGYLGLDPDQALRQHIKEQGLPTSSTTEKINIQEIMASESMAEAPRGLTGNHVLLLLLLLTLGFFLYWGYNSFFRPQATSEFYLPHAIYEEQLDNAVAPEEPAPPFLNQNVEEPRPAPEETAEPPSLPETSTAVEKEAQADAAEQMEDKTPSASSSQRRKESTPEPPQPSAPVIATPPPPAPAETLLQTKLEQTAEPESMSLESEQGTAPEFSQVLVARFTEDTWLRVQLDDEPPRQLFFQPGDTHTWRAHEKMELRIGNAGGVELSLNDNPLPSLGRSGQTVNLRLP